MTGRLRALGAVTAAALTLPLLVGGCDSTAKIFPQLIFFDRAMIVSAWPAKQNAQGTWDRVCSDASATGIITNVAFISTQRKEGSDQDLGIRPGDVVDGRTVGGGLPDDINLTNEGNLQLQVDCIDSAPHFDPAGTATCQGAANPSFSLDEVHYEANNAKRGDGHNIIVLVDFSGSNVGLVLQDANRQNLEARPGSFIPASDIKSIASDFQNIRIAAVKRFIRTLNPNDKVGVLLFSEKFTNHLVVPCSLAQGDLQNDLNTCFGKSDVSIWNGTGAGALDSYGGTAEGRSTLWEGIDFAYDFLTNLNDLKRGDHILVISDGPDTCAAGENATACESACSTTTADDVLGKIDPNSDNPIRIHFVQFESLGYPGRDARQVEASCLSGGQYQFINSNVFPRANTGQFSEAIETAILNVRFMLSGHWELASGVPAWQDNSAGTGTLLGSLYALNGTLTVRPSSNMVTRDDLYPFGIGQGEQADSATSWDRRPVLRKPCSAATDCGAAGPGAACQIICSSETLVCPARGAGVTAHDSTTCQTSGGLQGYCCQGTCEDPGGVCSTCPTN
ncbi:MAG: VWA domain-containing protein [Deltaproteobacteria bacterium]|nr:VWA domain-containing protein [Deltaproteobacteria bacterium]